MKGTFSYCRTKEAIKWMEAGDILLNLDSELYYKKREGEILVSSDSFRWNIYNAPMESFPPYIEWRSLSNLHYYEDLKLGNETAALKYLSVDHSVLSENDPGADKDKKRWFIGSTIDL